VSDLERFGTGTPDQDGCLTCGDVGVPVRVITVTARGAWCEDRSGTRVEIAVDFVPAVAPGDVLLVHAGVAIARMGSVDL